MSRKTPRPIYFTKLVLENIRSFSERQELKLVDRNGSPASWTLIVGDNGVGKTTLLQCLARMRPVFSPPADEHTDHQPNRIEPEFASEIDNDVFNDLVRSPSDTHAFLEASFSVGTPLNCPNAAPNGTISTRLKIARTGGAITGFYTNGNSNPDKPEISESPLVLAYGAGRHPKEIGVRKIRAHDPTRSLFLVEAALHDAEALLFQLEFERMKGYSGAEKLLHNLKCALTEILPDFDRPEDIEILGQRVTEVRSEESGVRVKTPHGIVSLNQLGLGYRTVFAWVVDIAWNMIRNFPDSENPLHESAIAIVDEIDLHLHPRWQREIREHLMKHFPNVQFIATAHSPLMAQVSLDGNLIVVQNHDDHALVCNDPVVINDWRLDQVVTSDLFNLGSSRSPEVERMLDRRKELVEKETLTDEERKELEELKERIRNLPTETSQEDQAAMEIIRRAAKSLQSKGNV